MTRFVALLLCVACGGDDVAADKDTSTDPAGDPTAELAADLEGRWVSAACEDLGGGNWLFRDFTFADGTWTLDGTVSSDAACATPSFTFVVSGPVELLGPSATLDGTWEADFGTTTKTLTVANAYVGGFLDTQPAGTCGAPPWTVGEAQDIAETGCAAFGLDPIAECPEEHDLVHLAGDELTLGDRSVSLCDARPTALSAAPLVRP
jgi:hypothetical protein